MELKDIRDQIDKLDDAAFDLIKQRHYLMKEMVTIKKIDNLPIEDKGREEQILERLGKKAEEAELDVQFIKEIYTLIIESSKARQKEAHSTKENRNSEEGSKKDALIEIKAPEDKTDQKSYEKHASDII